MTGFQLNSTDIYGIHLDAVDINNFVINLVGVYINVIDLHSNSC